MTTPNPPAAGGGHVEQILQDVHCPGCEYNLRGLYGAVVDCPECGVQCDMAKLVGLQWTKPWYQAPGFTLLAWPAIWAHAVVGVIAWATHNQSLFVPFHHVAIVSLAWLAVLGVWVYFMYRSYEVFEALRGCWLALITHVILAGYFAGLVAIVFGLIWGLIYFTDSNNSVLSHGLGGAGAVLCGVGVVFVLQRLDRWIAEQCIRQYLKRRSLPA